MILLLYLLINYNEYIYHQHHNDSKLIKLLILLNLFINLILFI